MHTKQQKPFSMFNNNYNHKEVQKYQSSFSYIGRMKSPFKPGQKQNLTTLARLFNPDSFIAGN